MGDRVSSPSLSRSRDPQLPRSTSALLQIHGPHSKRTGAVPISHHAEPRSEPERKSLSTRISTNSGPGRILRRRSTASNNSARCLCADIYREHDATIIWSGCPIREFEYLEWRWAFVAWADESRRDVERRCFSLTFLSYYSYLDKPNTFLFTKRISTNRSPTVR